MFTVTGVAGAITGPGTLALACEVVDQEGRESDSCTVTLDDRDGLLAVPAVDTELSVSMGYQETGVVFMGLFKVEDVELIGWPQTMVVNATGVGMGNDLWKQGRTQDYHQKTVSQIVSEIAQRNGVAPMVSGTVASFMYQYLGQTQESDLHFLTRLAAKHDAIGKVANNTLVFVKKGEGGLGTATATYPENVKQYDARIVKARPMHSETQGGRWDNEKSERVEETGSGGTGTAIHKLLPQYPDGQTEAQDAAQSRSDKLQRDTKELEIIIIGEPSVAAESMLQVTGVRAEIDGTWRIKRVTHTIDNSGYETVIDAELPGA